MGPLILGDDVTAFIPVIAISGGLLIALVSIIAGTFRKVMLSRHREDSRREIAAYIAEGSMTPDDGAKLMAAGMDKHKGCC